MTLRDSGSSASSLMPKIVVIGVGGAGGNAVNNMIQNGLEGVRFVVANTDAQALHQSLVSVENRIQLGAKSTNGLGAGSNPDVGERAAQESIEEILSLVKDAHMVFISAGMGGGTGTGAAPVIAKAMKDAGILTIGVVTKPFEFEGPNRTRVACSGIEKLQNNVDTLLVIPNQNLFAIATADTTFSDAFRMADNVLYSGVRGVTDLIIMPGLINLDFADIKTIMSERGGKAMMGTGEADGESRAIDAAVAAISNPLLDDVQLNGASGVLINITGGYDITLCEVDEAANRVRQEINNPDANIIFGSTYDERMNGKIRVSVVATGIGKQQSYGYGSRDGMNGPGFANGANAFFSNPMGDVNTGFLDSGIEDDQYSSGDQSSFVDNNQYNHGQSGNIGDVQKNYMEDEDGYNDEDYVDDHEDVVAKTKQQGGFLSKLFRKKNNTINLKHGINQYDARKKRSKYDNIFDDE